MRVASALCLTALLMATWACGLCSAAPAKTKGGVPPADKQPGRRYRAPKGCSVDDYCPEFVGQVHFTFRDYQLPPESRAYYMQVPYPVISRVYAVSDPDGTNTALWQLRTVTIDVEPEGLLSPDFSDRGDRITQQQNLLVPFLLDTSAPHVYAGSHLHRLLRANGALDGGSSPSLCNVLVPLPHKDVRCLRGFAPNPSIHANGGRKNVLGGAAAAVVMAVQTTYDLLRSQGKFRSCSTTPLGEMDVECDSDLAAAAEQLIETDVALQSILNSVVARDTGSAEAIRVTIDAQRRERRATMVAGLTRELQMLIQAPKGIYDDMDYVNLEARHRPSHGAEVHPTSEEVAATASKVEDLPNATETPPPPPVEEEKDDEDLDEF